MKSQHDFWNKYKPNLSMLLYAEVATAEQATLLAEGWLSKLAVCAPVVVRTYSQYWKIPSYFGFEFDFAPVESFDRAFDCLIELCPQGWTFMGNLPERSAIWNPIDGSLLLSEEVRWASVQLYYTESTESERE